MNDIKQSDWAESGTRVDVPMSSAAKTHLTMLSSRLSSLSKLISRMAVLGTPSSSASNLIFLSATMLPFRTSLAL
jgi:hypothetical protein